MKAGTIGPAVLLVSSLESVLGPLTAGLHSCNEILSSARGFGLRKNSWKKTRRPGFEILFVTRLKV